VSGESSKDVQTAITVIRREGTRETTTTEKLAGKLRIISAHLEKFVRKRAKNGEKPSKKQV